MSGGLDNRTLLLVAGWIYLLLPVSTWLVLKMPRRPATLLWCLGGTLGGFGLVAIGLRGRIPDLLSYVAGQPLLALGALLVTQSLRMDVGRALRWPVIAWAAAAYTLTLFALLSAHQMQALAVVPRVVNLTVTLLLIDGAWQVGRIEGSRSAKMIAIAYIVQAMGITANLIDALGGAPNNNPAMATQAGIASSVLTLMVATAGAAGYLGLALERSARSHVALAQEMSRTQQWRDRHEVLARLDRERALAVLADSLRHEITQPLTAALIRVQLAQRQLKAGELAPTQMLRWLDQIAKEVLRAGETVERIRNFIRPLRVQQAPVDMGKLLHAIQGLVRQEAINRRIHLRFSLGHDAWTLGDELQLSQAVLQITRNAMAAVAGQVRREVHVSLETTEELVRVRVADCGPGLPESLLGPERAEARPQSLHGIGLFVVQSILSRHHGALLLENTTGGAVVTLTLPRHVPDKPSFHHAPPRTPA